MNVRIPCLAVATLLILVGSSVAQDTIHSVAVPLKTPKKATDKRAPRPYDSAPVSAWLPPGAKQIRGAVVNPFYEKTVEQQHWRAACEQWDFALIGANFFGVRGEEFGPTIAGGLERLAKESGHAELAHAPMCFVGMSAGGGMSTRLTEAMPDRTIAAAPVCLEVGPRDAPSRQVPIVTIFGERDGGQMKKLLAKLPAEREAGARWAIAPQWRKRHEFARANNLAMVWFDRVIADRLGEQSTESAPKLNGYSDGAGYVGIVSSWEGPVARIEPVTEFKGNAADTCWFPDAYVAHVWRSFVTPFDSPLKISQPAGMGDGDTFQAHPANKPLVVRANVKGKAEFDQLLLLDGDQQIAIFTGESPMATVDRLDSGIHALIVHGMRDGKLAALSPPNTIVVK